MRLSIVGLIEGVAETTASLLKVFSGWLSDRLGDRKWLTVAGYSLSTLAKPFLYVANTWSAMLAVRFADRVGKGFRTAPRDALVADVVTPAQRGTAYGVYNAAFDLAAFPASLIAGLLWQGLGGWVGFGPAAPFLFGAGMALLAVVLLVVWLPRDGRA